MRPPKARPRRRSYNTRLVKRSYSYSLQEIAELFDVHINAVRRWIRDGLPKIDDHKPFLVHGSELTAFLDNRQKRRKRKCAADEFYCCRCRAPRRPRQGVVELTIENAKQVRLSAKCGTCCAPMNQIGSMRKLASYRSLFDVQTTDQRRIGERLEPGVMCHMDEEK